MTDIGYLTHYIKQSFGWVKIAEYAVPSFERVEELQEEIRTRHPHDTVRFTFRAHRRITHV